jgi:MOSC domain-containing protein YiiM
MIATQLDCLLIGKPKPFRADGTLSAMARDPVSDAVYLTKSGFVGDQVADPSVHGGPDKAVHFYPAEHYSKWIADFAQQDNAHPLLAQAGAFGENMSASGLTEGRVRIGDRFRIGAALVEVAQGRQPCWKLDHRFGMRGMSANVIMTGRCGLYFRVIEEGLVQARDPIEQIEQSAHDWTVEKVFHLLIGGGYKSEGGDAALHVLADLVTLAPVWRKRALQLLG